MHGISGNSGRLFHKNRHAAPAGVAAAGELARLRIARHRLHAAEVEVAGRPALDLPAVALERLERRGSTPGSASTWPFSKCTRGRSTASRAGMPPSTTFSSVWRIAERIRFEPAEPSTTSGMPSRSTTVGAIMLGILRPGVWRW